MAVTAFSSAQVALVTNDKPVLVGSNAVESAAVSHWLRANDLTGTSYDSTTLPIKRAYDRFTHLPTSPSAANGLHYLSFDLGADVKPWDMIMIGGHNFGTLGLSICKVQKADSNAFSSGLTDVHSFSPGSSNKRLVAFLASQYTTTDARYVRLVINLTTGTGIPEVGEFWLGRRRHLPYNFNSSTQNLRTRSDIVRFESRSGVTTNYVLSSGRAIREGSIDIDDSDHHDEVAGWWTDCDYGSQSFLWIEEPGTTPQNCHMMTTTPELSFEQTGPTNRKLDLAMVESAPYLSGES